MSSKKLISKLEEMDVEHSGVQTINPRGDAIIYGNEDLVGEIVSGYNIISVE